MPDTIVAINLRLPTELHAALVARARRERRSLQNQILYLLEAAETSDQDLAASVRLLTEADDLLTDGDNLDRIIGEGAPNIARWAQEARALCARHPKEC